MKKTLFLIPLLAAALGSCTSENNVNEPSSGSGATETRFLAVNIIDNTAGTRATDPKEDEYYEDGEGKENEVKTVRFYLFGEGEFENRSIDATPSLQDGEKPNVEKKLQAVIVFEAPKDETKPIEIVAIVNPPVGLAESYTSAAELQSVVGDYGYSGGDNQYFIMSNSVYLETKDTEKKEHVSYAIVSGKAHDSREEALADPVDIYVERVVAKIRVKTNLTQASGKNGIYLISSNLEDKSTSATAVAKVYNKEGNLINKNIYIKLLGWNVTGSTPKSRLVKKIQNSWVFPDWATSWNYEPFFRSFWAQNPDGDDAFKTSKDLKFGSFNKADDASRAANLELSSTTPNFIYVQENASWKADGTSPEYPTKLIVAAQLVELVENEENVVDLAWWKGTYYLKEALLQKLATESRLFYSEEGTDPSTTYKPLTDSDIEFKSASAVEGESTPTRYYSYAQFKGNSANKTWFTKTDKGEYEQVTVEDADGNITVIDKINDILKKLGETKVWDGGNTYYWTDIKHLGNQGYGDTGIVRNHIYDYTLTSFVGFGVPVLDPEETIYPEKPEDPEYAYIAARINILSWRLVTHDNTVLGWE